MNTIYLYKEIEALKKLDHPHIIKLETYFQLESDQMALVLEYAKEGTLKQYLNSKKKLDENESKRIIIQLLETLRYCHMKEIVHRDLKLDNIMLSNEEKNFIKIIDFGIAGLFQTENIKAGTIRYTAPEVLNGSDCDSRPSIDCWSVGCITYELLTGERLFKGEVNSEIRVCIFSIYFIFFRKKY